MKNQPTMKTITLTQDQFNQIQKKLSALYQSCQEGYDETWDCGSDEGRESFLPMMEYISFVAETLDAKLYPINFD